MKEYILTNFLHYQKIYDLDCKLRFIENDGPFKAYYDRIEKSINFENLESHDYYINFYSEDDKYSFILSVFIHEYRHAIVCSSNKFILRIINIAKRIEWIYDKEIEKNRWAVTMNLLLVSMFLDNFTYWTYFWLFNSALHLPIVLSELDANIFAALKNNYHRGLLVGQLSYISFPLTYVVLALLPQIIFSLFI